VIVLDRGSVGLVAGVLGGIGAASAQLGAAVRVEQPDPGALEFDVAVPTADEHPGCGLPHAQPNEPFALDDVQTRGERARR
jgi:hypothetical protein